MKKILTILLFLSFSSLLYAQVDLKEGLVAHYPFNGNANDESGNKLHGKEKGVTLTMDRYGIGNSAYRFDGNTYIEVSNHDLLNSSILTFSFWIKAESLDGGSGYYIVLNKEGQYEFAVFGQKREDAASPKEFAFALNPHWYWYGSSVKIIEKTYYHVVATLNSKNELFIYINGGFVKSHQYQKPLTSTNSCLRIGARGCNQGVGKPAALFDGVIDDIRIYNRVLNECEIELLYKENSVLPKGTVNSLVENAITSWKKKDEYETKSEWKKRVSTQLDTKIDELRTKAIKEVSSNIVWTCGTKKYNADKEEFTLNFNNVETFKLKVPRKEAREFGDNFDKLEYISPQFSIGAQPNLIVDCITIKNPVNGKEYKYGCQTGIQNLPKGTIKVKSKTVTVKIWDDAKEDGDIVSIFLNDARLKKEIKVSKQEHIFTLELKKGINTFKLLAHNEGASPPNTAAILIDDGVNEYQRVLSSKKDEFAILNIVLE